MCVGVTIVTDMMATQGQMTREFVVSNLHWRAPDTTALPMQVPNPQGTASQLSKLESNSWPQPEHNQNTRTIATKGSSEKLSHSLSTQQSKTLIARAANYARDSSPSAIHRAEPNFSKFGSLWIAPALGRRHEGRELLGSDKRDRQDLGLLSLGVSGYHRYPLTFLAWALLQGECKQWMWDCLRHRPRDWTWHEHL